MAAAPGGRQGQEDIANLATEYTKSTEKNREKAGVLLSLGRKQKRHGFLKEAVASGGSGEEASLP